MTSATSSLCCLAFKPQFASLLLLFPLTLASTAPARLKIEALKAQLFYEDKGTFSEDVSSPDTGPPYVPPTHWNTPMQYENRSSSVFVTVEVTGEPEGKRKLEFIARYIPWQRGTRAVVIRKIVSINIPVKVGKTDNYHAGFWLYDTGCNPVRLSAHIIGSADPPTKRVIKFGCGE